MTTRSVAVLLLIPLVSVSLLTGCGGGAVRAGVDQIAASQDPSETPLCPPGGDESPQTDECIVVDTEANMDLNNAYAERLPISADAKAELDLLVAPVTAALRPLEDGSVPVTTASVTAALASVGIDSPQLKGETEHIGFAHALAGCLFGEVKAGLLIVETGGFIADGGCMTAPGH